MSPSLHEQPLSPSVPGIGFYRNGWRCGFTREVFLPGGIMSPPPPWPLHDIVITNIVWCIAYKREHCPMAVLEEASPPLAFTIQCFTSRLLCTN